MMRPVSVAITLINRLTYMGLASGALAGALLTAPLIGLMYLFDKLAGLPFVPYALFDWIARVLPGPVVTFGIDLMIDSMLLAGISVAAASKTAEGTGGMDIVNPPWIDYAGAVR